ncbi:MAG: glycosyltransferase family 9 protein [Thermodesulfovibrionales bacterium]
MEFRWHQISGGEAFAEPFLPCPCSLRERATEFLFSRGWSAGRPLIVIHPGSGGARKCWGKERFHGLMQMLRAAIDPFIILLSGPADDRLRDWAEVTAGDDAAIIHLSGADLPTVFSLLGSCDLYIGNDSGVSHLAGLAGCKVISIFGPTDPALWRPRGRAVKVIAPEADCAPCAGSASCNDRQCLSGISLERVLREALTFQLK